MDRKYSSTSEAKWKRKKLRLLLKIIINPAKKSGMNIAEKLDCMLDGLTLLVCRLSSNSPVLAYWMDRTQNWHANLCSAFRSVS